MPRRRSSFGGRSSSNSRNTRTAQAPRQAPAQGQTQSRPGMFGSLMGTMFQGMAFGAGSEVAHQTMRSWMGGDSQAQQHQQQDSTVHAQTQNQQQTQQNSCTLENNNFVECLKFNSNNISDCQSYLDSLKQCESQR